MPASAGFFVSGIVRDPRKRRFLRDLLERFDFDDDPLGFVRFKDIDVAVGGFVATADGLRFAACARFVEGQVRGDARLMLYA